MGYDKLGFQRRLTQKITERYNVTGVGQRKGYTDLANAIGTKAGVITRIVERGTASIAMLAAIAQELHVDLDWLVLGEGEPTPKGVHYDMNALADLVVEKMSRKATSDTPPPASAEVKVASK